jgi:uncharacterized protein DUF1579
MSTPDSKLAPQRLAVSEVMDPPKRSARHEALGAFVGRWKASGTTYEGANTSPWESIYTARWHDGGFFVVQDEHANGPFDPLSVLGWDDETGAYFSIVFENHGFVRKYLVEVQGDVWTFSGLHERARVEFSDDNTTQTIHWELKRGDTWGPLCDRVARKIV